MSLPTFDSENLNETTNGNKVIAWNFVNNEIQIRNMYVQTLTGKEAIKNKVIKILKTDKGLAQIYKDRTYGIDRNALVGREYHSNKVLVDSAMEDMKNQIKKINGVLGVKKLNAKVEGSILSISFSIDTIFGEVGEILNA